MKSGIPLGLFVDFHKAKEDDDFWIWRRHNEDMVGKPTRAYNPEHIGVKVRPGAKNIILPNYLYYLIEHLHQQGYFRPLAHGTTRLVNIRIKDLEDIRIILPSPDGGRISTVEELRQYRKSRAAHFKKRKLGHRHKVRAPWYHKYIDWLMGDRSEPAKSPHARVQHGISQTTGLDLESEKWTKNIDELTENLRGLLWVSKGEEWFPSHSRGGIRDSAKYATPYIAVVKRDRSGEIITYFDEAGFEEWHYLYYVSEPIVRLFRYIRRLIRKGLAPAHRMPDYFTEPTYRRKLKRGQTRLRRFR